MTWTERLILAGILFALAAIIWDDVAADDYVIGTILVSDHWFDDGTANNGRGYNEQHNGWFIGYNDFKVGQYQNSEFTQSTFAAWTPPIYYSDYFSWMVGAANGYLDQDIMPMIGASAQYEIVYVTLVPNVVFAGLLYEF